MNQRVRLFAAAAFLAVQFPAKAQDAPAASVQETTSNLLPESGSMGSAAPPGNRAELPGSTPRQLVPPPSTPSQMDESDAVSRGPAMSPPPNVSVPATYRSHDPTAAAEMPAPRRDLGIGDGPTPHGRRVSDVRDAVDRTQIREGAREMATGERDIRRGRLMIEEGERPGHNRRDAAEGAALVRRGESEIQQGWQERRSGTTDLHRGEIAAHRVGMEPTPLQRTEQAEARRAYRERAAARSEHYYGTSWQHNQAAHAKKKWGSE